MDLDGGPVGPERGPHHDPGLLGGEDRGQLLVIQQQQPGPGGIAVRAGERLEDDLGWRRLVPSPGTDIDHAESRREPSGRWQAASVKTIGNLLWFVLAGFWLAVGAEIVATA